MNEVKAVEDIRSIFDHEQKREIVFVQQRGDEDEEEAIGSRLCLTKRPLRLSPLCLKEN
jgi:hypothetical protein